MDNAPAAPATLLDAEDAPPLLRFIIARSRARSLVLRYLAAIEASYASEIARGTGLTVSNVTGALLGKGDRYAGKRSLVQLGLVRQGMPRVGQPRVFSITPAGLELAERLARAPVPPRAAAPMAVLEAAGPPG